MCAQGHVRKVFDKEILQLEKWFVKSLCSIAFSPKSPTHHDSSSLHIGYITVSDTWWMWSFFRSRMSFEPIEAVWGIPISTIDVRVIHRSSMWVFTSLHQLTSINHYEPLLTTILTTIRTPTSQYYNLELPSRPPIKPPWGRGGRHRASRFFRPRRHRKTPQNSSYTSTSLCFTAGPHLFGFCKFSVSSFGLFILRPFFIQKMRCRVLRAKPLPGWERIYSLLRSDTSTLLFRPRRLLHQRGQG